MYVVHRRTGWGCIERIPDRFGKLASRLPDDVTLLYDLATRALASDAAAPAATVLYDRILALPMQSGAG